MIRVSQWAEIRQMHLVEGIPKKEIARRLGLNVKTIRRALQREEAPIRRVSPLRERRLDPWRDEIEGWLKADPKITAKRIRRLLLPEAGSVPGRTVREYVAAVREELFPREAYVHRSQAPGQTMEADFGETWARIRGRLRKVKFLAAVLSYSNVYFAKAYAVERLECLLDGIAEAFEYFGGVTERVVLDNTSLAVKRVLKGRDREQTEAFEGFRGAYPFEAEFCARGKAWEKGSVEGGVRYVRNNAFRPMPSVDSFEELNALIVEELEADLDGRHLDDGRPVQEAWVEERERLRPLPAHPPESCRTLARVADKFGHVRVDGVHYSVPIRHAYRPVWVKLYHNRVEIVVGAQVVAVHERSFREGDKVLEPLHVLPLLERKHRAVGEATALRGWKLPEAFWQLRRQLHRSTRRPDREWVKVLRLLESHAEQEVEAAVEEALRRDSPRYETVRLLLRQEQQGDGPKPRPVPVCTELATVQVQEPALEAYDALWRTG